MQDDVEGTKGERVCGDWVTETKQAGTARMAGSAAKQSRSLLAGSLSQRARMKLGYAINGQLAGYGVRAYVRVYVCVCVCVRARVCTLALPPRCAVTLAPHQGGKRGASYQCPVINVNGLPAMRGNETELAIYRDWLIEAECT